MLPDLGPYGATVVGAYGVTLALLGGLVLLSALRAAQVRRALGRLERGGDDGRA